MVGGVSEACSLWLALRPLTRGEEVRAERLSSSVAGIEDTGGGGVFGGGSAGALLGDVAWRASCPGDGLFLLGRGIVFTAGNVLLSLSDWLDIMEASPIGSSPCSASPLSDWPRLSSDPSLIGVMAAAGSGVDVAVATSFLAGVSVSGTSSFSSSASGSSSSGWSHSLSALPRHGEDFGGFSSDSLSFEELPESSVE